uniref:Uncharacterized protein n=1 Tax=Rhizophagus irregularis (strain DAOM 181602 / DAOM 197198 / MUCL 43194) TaxID=747089 RepID=U9TTP0_RHIID
MFRLVNLLKTVIRRYSNNNNVTSKAHEFLSSDKLKTFCNSAGLVTFGGAAVLGNWKLVNSSIDRSLVPINSVVRIYFKLFFTNLEELRSDFPHIMLILHIKIITFSERSI